MGTMAIQSVFPDVTKQGKRRARGPLAASQKASVKRATSSGALNHATANNVEQRTMESMRAKSSNFNDTTCTRLSD